MAAIFVSDAPETIAEGDICSITEQHAFDWLVSGMSTCYLSWLQQFPVWNELMHGYACWGGAAIA